MAGSNLNRRQFIGMIGATAAAYALAACTPGGAGSVENPPKSPEQVDAIDLTDQKVEVVYWHNRSQKDQDLLQSMLDEFNTKNEWGIKARAEIAGASYNDVYSRVSSAIQVDQPPDMSIASQTQAAIYRGKNAVVDLTPFQTSAKHGLSEADLKDYHQTFIDSDANPQFKGEKLGFATQRSMDVMYVNLDWLAKLGYDEPPTDWKTFEEACKKAADPASKRYGFAFRHDASNFASQVFSRGGRILAEDGQSYVFNSQAGVDTIEMLQRMLREKTAVEIPTSDPASRTASPPARSSLPSPRPPTCGSTRRQSRRARSSGGISPSCPTPANRRSTSMAPASRSTRPPPRGSLPPGS